MAHHAREAARIIAGLKDRIERLEDEKTTEAVPNPLRDIADKASTSDAVSTDTGNRGNMAWGVDDWAFAEWDDPDTKTLLDGLRRPAEVAGVATEFATKFIADASLKTEVFGNVENAVVTKKTGLHKVTASETVGTRSRLGVPGLDPSDPILNVTKVVFETVVGTETAETTKVGPPSTSPSTTAGLVDTVAATNVSEQVVTLGEILGTEDLVRKPTIVDSFEDSDISEYQGATDAFTTTSSPTKHGSVALDRTGSSGVSKIESQSGLATYPKQGDIFKYYIRFDSGFSEGGLRFAYTGTGDHYRVEYDETDNRWELAARAAGTETALDTTGGDQTTGVWYEVKVTWDDGTLGGSTGDITMEVTDVTNNTSVGTASINDTNHTSGGILWYSWLDTSTQHVYYDYLHITNR